MKHELGPNCWCGPKEFIFDLLTGAKAWSHSETGVQKPFDDVADFMKACGQTVGVPNEQQSGLYWSLIDEEYAELEVAEFDSVGELDAVVDLIVVLVGYAHSRGWNIDAAWEEVHRSNKAKIDPVTGMVTKRSDGKILKPPGWTPPNLIPAMGANHESN